LPIIVKHPKISEKADGQDDSLIQPTDWNAVHDFDVNATSLVGNPTGSVAAATNIPLSDDFKFVDGKLSLDAEDGQIVFAEQLTDTPTVDWTTTTTEIKADVPNAAITLAKMELGPTGGEILYYDKTSKAPVRLPYGTKGMVLQTGTAEVTGPPVVAATNPAWGFSGFPHAVLQGQKAGTEGSFALGAWRTRLLATEVYDLFDLVLIQTQGTPAVGTNRFRLVAGTYVAEWSAPAFQVNAHQTRLYNITGAAVISHGTTEYSNDNNSSQTRSVGIAKFTIAANNDLELQHQCALSNTANGMGVASPFTSSLDIFSQMKIWRIS